MLVTVCLFFIFEIPYAQQLLLQNPSFEAPSPYVNFPQWTKGFQTPDVEPYGGVAGCNTLSAFEGDTYLGMGGGAVLGESVYQKLEDSIQKGQKYKFSLALSKTNSTLWNCGGIKLNAPKLQIYGCNYITFGGPLPGSFQGRELLWESDSIDHVGWKVYEGILEADSNYAYFMLEARSANDNEAQYVLVDALSNLMELHPVITFLFPQADTIVSCDTLDPLWFQTDSLASQVSLYSSLLDSVFMASPINDSIWSVPGFVYPEYCSIKSDTLVVRGIFAHGYQAYDTLLVESRCQKSDCPRTPTIPNLITPNGDGKNDFFEVDAGSSELSLKLYNRWGECIYQSAFYPGDWPQESIADGMYYYWIECEGIEYKGWLQVLR